MSDDTIRTKAITYTRDHVKEIIAYAIAVASSVVAGSVAYGHKQADSEMLSTTVKELTTKVDALSGKVDDIAISQAEMKGTLTVVKDQVQSVVQFKTDVTEGIKDANQVRIPKLTGHRAKH